MKLNQDIALLAHGRMIDGNSGVDESVIGKVELILFKAEKESRKETKFKMRTIFLFFWVETT